MEKLLELKNINKSFSGIQVLHDVGLTLHKGEIMCLVGENGAGKSTLIKILSGAENPDSGEIIIGDQKFDRLEPNEAMKLGIATIYQDVDLVETLTVADNIYQGSEILKGLIVVDKKKQESESQKLLDELNINIDPSVLVETLSPGQKQNLQIVKALHKKAKIIIMDEPTSSLGEEEKAGLMELIDKLIADGIGIIYISHFLDEIFEIGHRAMILKDGHTVTHRELANTTQEQLINDMVGRDASSFYAKDNHSRNDNALEIKHYSFQDLVKDVNFTVSRGEIFGLGGLVGAGRTELVEMIFGIRKPESGKLILDGKDITPKNPKDAIKKGIAFVSEDRQEEGMFLERSAKENIMVSKNESKFLLNLTEERTEVDKRINELNIRVFNQEHEVGKLSGGNQQKVVVSRWLTMTGDIYIFDEPTKGVDVGAREEIYTIMEELSKIGKIIIMVSSSMPELLSMSDRIGVMRKGVLEEIVPSENATEDILLKLYMGIEDEYIGKEGE